ncbi:hypothetical protein PENSPDRAFT_71925 [Peniophora sp. CONT]|nr:hypothetical protein PENSPDRAFT_71925 [Peniophora sp. CONT]
MRDPRVDGGRGTGMLPPSNLPSTPQHRAHPSPAFPPPPPRLSTASNSPPRSTTTAVMPAMDAFRNSLDDDALSSSTCGDSVDWKSKYHEVREMLEETRNELDDFHTSSKELEEELERELQRTEKAHQDMKVKLERAEGEREEWKGKFMSLQTNHNTTTTSLQRELDQLRGDYQKIKVQLRELEMGNDDLERNERAVSSSLADIEAKYSRALEEKILLEHELLDKAHIEEESQRWKDELRDANAEIGILRDQLATAHERASVMTFTSSSEPSPPTPSSSLHHSDEDLLADQKAPSDLQLSDLTPDSEFTPVNSTSTVPETPRSSSHDSDSGHHQALLQKSSIGMPRTHFASPETPRSLPRPKYNSPSTPSRLPPPRTTVTRPTPRVPPAAVSSLATPVPRSRGVQMVSEMRAKVRNLEQKIHTRVPRIRMGSTSRPAPPPQPASIISRPSSLSSTASAQPTAGSSKGSVSRRPSAATERRSIDQRRSPDGKRAGGDTGWVLVMEDSPSPKKDKADVSRRASLDSSPTRRAKVRPFATTTNISPRSNSPPLISPLARSTIGHPSALKRPQSRLSSEGRSSIGTTATVSSIPTPSSRPTSPTFLPLPSASLYASTSALKRSTGPGAGGPYSGSGGSAGPKRSSLGASTALRSPVHDAYMSDSGLPSRPRSIPAPGKSALSGSPSSFRSGDSPLGRSTTVGHPNVTVRGSGGRMAGSASTGPNGLGQSRIGRPQFTSGRRSAGGEDELSVPGGGRPRSGSTRVNNRF